MSGVAGELNIWKNAVPASAENELWSLILIVLRKSFYLTDRRVASAIDVWVPRRLAREDNFYCQPCRNYWRFFANCTNSTATDGDGGATLDRVCEIDTIWNSPFFGCLGGENGIGKRRLRWAVEWRWNLCCVCHRLWGDIKIIFGRFLFTYYLMSTRVARAACRLHSRSL